MRSRFLLHLHTSRLVAQHRKQKRQKREDKKMINYLKIMLVVACALMQVSAQAQKKVTYGKTTFTLFQPLPNMAPTPVCGFAPEVP